MEHALLAQRENLEYERRKKLTKCSKLVKSIPYLAPKL